MKELTVSEKLILVLEKESPKFSGVSKRLNESIEKFSKLGFEESSYKLPLKDTIGRNFRELLSFKSI